MSACVKRLSAILSLALAVALPLLAAQQAALADDGALMGGDPAVLNAGATVDGGTFGGCDWSVVDDAGDGYLRLVISPSASPEWGYEAGVLPPNEYGIPSFWPWLRHADSITSAEIQGGVSLEGSAAYMFGDCSAMTSANLSGLDTEKVERMDGMFSGCSSLASLDGVSGWKTGNVTDMGQMFHDCSSLTSLDLSGWNTEKVSSMGQMFRGCSSLTPLDLSGWNTEKVEHMDSMFSGCSSLTSLDLSGWNTEKVERMDCMFRGCSSLASIGDLSSWETGSVNDMGEMFRGCSQLTSLDLSGWNTEKVSNMGQMFRGCSQLTSAAGVSGWETAKVEYMDGMFYGCSQLASLDLSGWDTGSVTDMHEMFYGCSQLASLGDLSGWDTSAVANMDGIFTGCSSLSGIPVAFATVEGIADRVYDGKAQTQSPTVKLGAEVLAEGTDYALSYEDNVDAGTATVTITGAGRYAGSVSRTFKIARAEISVPKAVTGLVYNGKAQAGVPAGKGYYVTGGTATNAGGYTATATADKNHAFSGGASTAAVEWSIAKAGQSISASDASRTYGAAAFNLGARLAAGDGKLSYSSSNAKVAAVDGSGNVTVKGAGTAKITVAAAATANYKAASRAVTVTVGKAANPLKLAKATRTVKAKNVEKKNIVVRGAKLVKAGQGTMTYSIKPIAKKYKKFKKHVGINKKTGKIAIMKGCPKGTFTVTVKATAKGNANYKSAARTAVVTIRVK